MNDNLEQPSLPRSVDTTASFKNYAEAFRSLRGILPPISEQVRTEYVNRVRASSSSRYIAFRLLALRAVGDMQTKLTPFIPLLEEILFADTAPLDLRRCDSIEAVGNAVAETFASVRGKNDLKQFAAARSHLPILYALIRVWDNPTRFQAGLNALAAAVERITRPKKAKPSNNLEILARAVIARIPEKPLIGKALPEILKIAQTLFLQAETTSRENLELESKVAKANTDVETLRAKLDTELEAKQKLQADSAILVDRLSQSQTALAQEKEHFEILKSHGVEERKRAVDDAVARMRTELLRRVENIRLFADRDQPNRQGILALVGEIQNIFTESEGGKP